VRVRFQGILATFLIGSFGGWIFDSAYRSILAGALVLSGPTYPPFYPSYGFGTLLLCFAVRAFARRRLLERALAYAAVTTLWELGAGLFLTYVLAMPLWDYSGNRFHLLGQVDLEHSFYWMLLAFFFERTLYPRLAPHVFAESAGSAAGATAKAA
jgi:uncharacterized membrane protein